ncbi:DHH family phosphoesterase [Mariniplasma anaerobium]|uniref:Oligoribonuclease n=1 Tax=Mariniplasma anaerobium TaxID=2735436 RepID=A0A7U9TIQ4_9MOLU|nr:bifunctional oligoribonuclease/PAP phosphatase NrnA [Mariniplasma anaerobium]BCR36859.1 oligoribonuclease [Mariniplasma anaerobium]
MKRILNKIKQAETIIIHGHKRPDGDCYGAQFGLKDIIKTTFPEKHVYVVGQTSDFVDFVGKVDTITDDKYANALVIVVDTATAERISDPRYEMGSYLIKIDHHIPVDDYGDLRWVDTSFPSCAQMIAYFYHTFKNELKLTKQGAIALYTGIVTDTGRFRYRGVSKVTHQLAGMLLEKGVDVEFIDQSLSKETLAMVALKGYVYSNYVACDGFIYIKMTRDVINKFGITDEQAASLVNSLSGIEGFPVWALFIEYPDEIRIRLRSNGPTINTLANKYEGGGHAKASGCRIKSWKELDAFVKDAEEVVKEYKNEA